MSNPEPFFPHATARTDGRVAWERYERVHEGNASRVEQVRKLGAQALVSAAAVLGVDPVDLGFGLRDGQLASALTAGEPMVSAEIAEHRLEIAIACVGGWAEQLARRVRQEGSRQADRLDGLAREIRQEQGRMQHLLFREGTVRRTRSFSLTASSAEVEFARDSEEVSFREQIAVLVLQLQRQQAEITERESAVARLRDDQCRLRAQLEESEQERGRLKLAADGWRQEATAGRRRRVARTPSGAAETDAAEAVEAPRTEVQ